MITSLLRHYCVIITIAFWHIIMSLLCHHYLNIMSLLQIHYFISLHHYYVIITWLIYVIITSLLHHYYIIIPFCYIYYYIVITYFYIIITSLLQIHFTSLLHRYYIVITSLLLHCYFIFIPLLHHYYIVTSLLLHCYFNVRSLFHYYMIIALLLHHCLPRLEWLPSLSLTTRPCLYLPALQFQQYKKYLPADCSRHQLSDSNLQGTPPGSSLLSAEPSCWLLLRPRLAAHTGRLSKAQNILTVQHKTKCLISRTTLDCCRAS